MIVFAVDPGKVTGYAVWERGELIVASQRPHMEFLDYADRFFSGAEVLDTSNTEIHVACESYTITAATIKKDRGQNWSLEQIGALRWMAHMHQLRFTLQKPADAMRLATDKRLQKLGWWSRGKGHANDATRHLVLYLVSQRALDPALLLA